MIKELGLRLLSPDVGTSTEEADLPRLDHPIIGNFVHLPRGWIPDPQRSCRSANKLPAVRSTRRQTFRLLTSVWTSVAATNRPITRSWNSFNERFREESLNAHWFESIDRCK
jgi:hypothetical protein